MDRGKSINKCQLADLQPEISRQRDFVVFGGSFDPIHQGHVLVIKRLLEKFKEVVVAPTPQNPWKDLQPAPMEIRVEMIRAVLAQEKIAETQKFDPNSAPASPSVHIELFPYIYSVELVRHLRAMTTRTFWWAVGADSAEDVEKWRDWQTYGVPVVVVPVEIECHSIEVREGTRELHPAAQAIAKRGGWYKP